MNIYESFHDLPLLQTVSHRYIGRDGELRTETESILCEHLIRVYVNGTLTMKLVCLAEHLSQLILGRLLTEEIITGIHEVESIRIDETGKRADVLLHKTEEITQEAFVETTPSSCTANHTLNDHFKNHAPLGPVVPIPWKKEWIFDLADRFAAGMPLHDRTFATHSCFLSMEGELLFQCEDIGRHNALDKAIGYALIKGIDLKKCIVYSSGRIPTDMAVKAIRSGIPILASKASPTKEAAELAAAYNLTLICAARRDRMKLFAGSLYE